MIFKVYRVDKQFTDGEIIDREVYVDSFDEARKLVNKLNNKLSKRMREKYEWREIGVQSYDEWELEREYEYESDYEEFINDENEYDEDENITIERNGDIIISSANLSDEEFNKLYYSIQRYFDDLNYMKENKNVCDDNNEWDGIINIE